ncbi:MAG: proteasome assembly chaperone family protein [Mycobacteriales bacterium]
MEPGELFRFDGELPDLGSPVLIHALDGFIDAGSARRLAREHLLASGSPQRVATFDADLLYDYRARRPPMLFVEDHWESYDGPDLVLQSLTDATGTPYLLLSGPEPDVYWERFVEAMRLIAERLNVRLTIGLNAIPMAVPHTRSVGVIAHGSRRELVTGFDPWIATVQVPGSASHVMEYRFGQAGNDAVGFAVHVPHYLSQMDYPAAAEVLLQSVSRVSGLVLPTAELATAAAETRRLVDEQIEGNADVAAVVRSLEEQYDAFVASRGDLLVGDATRLPTADELGAELERFLAQQQRGPSD